MDQKQFEEMMARAAQASPQGQPSKEAAQPSPEAGTTPQPEAPMEGGTEPSPMAAQSPPTAEPSATGEPDYSQPPAEEPGLGDPSGLDAIFGGGLQSVFETKDFLFGDTPKDQQSGFRQSVEKTVKERSEQSMIDGFSAGVGSSGWR